MTNLNFTQGSNGKWKASVTSEGSPITVQLQQTQKGVLSFYANLSGKSPIPIKVLAPWEHGTDIITSINVPNGVKITIESETQISGGYES